MSITRAQAQKFISEKQFEKLSFIFLIIFKTYWERPKPIIPSEVPQLENVIIIFLDSFTQADFIIPEQHYLPYLKLSSILARLTALTSLRTTDNHLKWLYNEERISSGKIIGKNDFVKILTLFSANNQSVPDYSLLFKTNAELASYWYWDYFYMIDYISETSIRNLNNHSEKFTEIEDSLVFNFSYFAHETAFLITYINPGKDKIIKQKLNSMIREKYLPVIGVNPFISGPATGGKKKIAVISGLLWRRHAVFKGTYNLIKALSADYELTLYLFKTRLLPDFAPETDGVFQDLKFLELKEENISEIITQIRQENFSMILYPDIGMTYESLFLSNFRMAPVQVNIAGHSVSSFGSDIDYFISGTESENLAEAENNYSERLVVIPGIGLSSEIPTYSRNYFPTIEKDFVIVCPWSSHKINRPLLLTLQKISLLADKKISFVFFTSFNHPDHIIPEREIIEILGNDKVRFHGAIPYQKYMTIFEKGNISIDSFHFGGFNTVIDALYLGKPVVTLEGDKAYNKFAAGLLRKSGLAELIASDEQEYIEKVVKLINNPEYFEKMKKQVKALDLKEILLESGEPEYFKKAVDYIIENHQMLKAENSQSPIIINK